jgi:hypothetical protein
VYTIYTDALAIPNDSSNRIGVGLVAFSNTAKPVFQDKANLGPCQLVYNGELEGITQAIKCVSHIAKPGQEFRIKRLYIGSKPHHTTQDKLARSDVVELLI